MKKFEELTEREVLALAIALEEEDERVYADFAEGLRQDYPATASMFEGMREEESGHRRRQRCQSLTGNPETGKAGTEIALPPSW